MRVGLNDVYVLYPFFQAKCIESVQVDFFFHFVHSTLLVGICLNEWLRTMSFIRLHWAERNPVANHSNGAI